MSSVQYWGDEAFRHFMDPGEYQVSKMVERRSRRRRENRGLITLEELPRFLDYLEGREEEER